MAGLALKPEHYLYSSANDYAEEKGLFYDAIVIKWRTVPREGICMVALKYNLWAK